METTLTIQDDTTPKLQKLISKIRQRQPLMLRLGKVLQVELRAHFRAKDATPNARGWPRKHFWRHVRESTSQPTADNDQAIVTITHPGFAHKVEGGEVYPSEARYLAIPLTAEASKAGYPRDKAIPGVFRPKGHDVLGISKDGHFISLWALKRHVTHREDPTALPPTATLAAKLLSTADDYVTAALGRERARQIATLANIAKEIL
jgi:hypothetical protein